MCRILSLSGNYKKERAALIFRSFRKLAKDGKVYDGMAKGHRDGWGIGSYLDDNNVFLLKRPTNALIGKGFKKTVDRVLCDKPNVVISHLRKASTGVKKKDNSHPFYRDGFLFCHNGTIFNSINIPLRSDFKKNIKGQTDSEKFFLYIIQLISDHTKKTPVVIRRSIEKAVNLIRVNFDYTALNFILTNGKYLWALREISDKYQPENFEKRKKYYTLFQGKSNDNCIIICSERLGAKIESIKWDEIDNHELLEINLRNNRSKIVKI